MQRLRIFFTLVLLSITGITWGMDVSRFHSGSWFNPEQSGHGLSVQVVNEDLTVVYWYVYNPDGTPTFLTSALTNSGNTASGKAYIQYGMPFGSFETENWEQLEWGQFELVFHSCDTATFNYSSTVSYGETEFGSGSISMSRLVSIDENQCGENPYAGLYIGTYQEAIGRPATPAYFVLTPYDEFIVVVEGGVAAYGSWSAANRTISAIGTATTLYPNAGAQASVTMAGEIEPEHRIKVQVSAPGIGSGIIDAFSVSSLYRNPVPFSKLAGSYQIKDFQYDTEGSATIFTDGTFSASDDSGCSFTGGFGYPDSKFNLLSVIVDVSNCGSGNGRFNGYAVVLDGSSIGDKGRIVLFGTNGSAAVVTQLLR